MFTFSLLQSIFAHAVKDSNKLCTLLRRKVKRRSRNFIEYWACYLDWVSRFLTERYKTDFSTRHFSKLTNISLIHRYILCSWFKFNEESRLNWFSKNVLSLGKQFFCIEIRKRIQKSLSCFIWIFPPNFLDFLEFYRKDKTIFKFVQIFFCLLHSLFS